MYGLEKFRATIEEFRLENTDGCGAFIRNSSSGRLQFSDKIPTKQKVVAQPGTEKRLFRLVLVTI